MGVITLICGPPFLTTPSYYTRPSELVRTYPGQAPLVTTWVQGVFPLILDVEAKAAEKVLECVWELLLSNLVAAGRATTALHALPWTILAAVEKCAMTNYLDRSVLLLEQVHITLS